MSSPKKLNKKSIKRFGRDSYVVVNADDFGLSAKINEGIFRAHEKGFLTSTSLMANGPMFCQAVEMSQEAPSLGVGVHLNLVRGRPISDLDSVNRLIDKRGFFPGRVAAVMRRLMQGPVGLEQAELECHAQVEHILKVGIHPTHFDSEKHLHMYPPLFKRVAKVAGSYGIKWVRIAAENGTLWRAKASPIQKAKAFLLRRCAVTCRKYAKKSDLMISDYFYGVMHAGHMVKEVYEDIVDRISPGVTEIICHPGFHDVSNTDRGMGPSFLAPNRKVELDALLDRTLMDRLKSRKIILVNFGDLA